MTGADRNPVDDLVDLLVYAPVGLLYEYDEVLPKLVRRGKSQVQLARVVGQMALGRGGLSPANLVVDTVVKMVADRVSEIGASIGLTVPGAEGPADEPPGPSEPEEVIDVDEADDVDEPEPVEDDPDRPLPIAAYDDLTAREIIGLLDELDAGQLARIRDHEAANRARKTVIGKLDRLQS